MPSLETRAKGCICGAARGTAVVQLTTSSQGDAEMGLHAKGPSSYVKRVCSTSER